MSKNLASSNTHLHPQILHHYVVPILSERYYQIFLKQDNYVSRAATYFEFPFSVSALQDSAQSGCELCSSLVSDSLEEGRTDDEKANERSSWSTCSDDGLSPEDENIRLRVSIGKIFYLYDAEGGVGYMGVLQFDTDRNGMWLWHAALPSTTTSIEKRIKRVNTLTEAITPIAKQAASVSCTEKLSF
jgi:hypothetical protein